MRFVIFGCGGFGRELLNPAIQMGALAGDLSEVVFASDFVDTPVIETPVISPDDLSLSDVMVIALGDPATRRSVAQRFSHIPAGRLVAPSAIIGPDVELGEGAILCDYTMITASARIGRHFHSNIYSYVAHDCVIGDFVTFAPRVCCNGRVHIEDGAYIGTGVVIREGTPDKPTVIGAGAVVGAGSVVIKDVPPGMTVVGIPAKPIDR